MHKPTPNVCTKNTIQCKCMYIYVLYSLNSKRHCKPMDSRVRTQLASCTTEKSKLTQATNHKRIFYLLKNGFVFGLLFSPQLIFTYRAVIVGHLKKYFQQKSVDMQWQQEKIESLLWKIQLPPSATSQSIPFVRTT